MPTIALPAARRGLLAVALGLVATSGSAQTAELPELTFSGETAVSWVLVPVAVRAADGPVGGLGLADFTLRVDGAPVAVESFDVLAEAPLSLILLQDVSGSMANAGKLDASRDAIRCIVERFRRGDELAVVTFASGQISVDVPFTDDRRALAEASASWHGWGTTMLHDAVALLPEIRLGGSRGDGAALLVTDGLDNASVLAPEKARELARRAQIPVFVLALGAGPQPQEASPESLAAVLERLAQATDGALYPVADGAAAVAACDDLLERLRQRYLLGFRIGDHEDESYRRLTVEVAAKGYEVSHRLGYVGAAPLATGH